MVPTTRKQREIQARHEQFLDVARALLLEKGYTGLSMDKIADATEYSKGTLYQHFRNKEEVVVALATSTAEIRTDLFRQAATFQGRPRERMTAVGIAAEMFFKRYPHHFQSEQTARAAVIEKISPESAHKLQSCESRCMGIVSGIVRDGVAQGDLALPDSTSAEQLSFGLWAMSFGAFGLMAQRFGLEQLGIPSPHRTLAANQHRLLDGYGWRPLTNEWDYEATRERVLATVLDLEPM